MYELIDNYGRKINYLRISITDRCNLRCRYCIPSDGIKLIARNEILSYEEIYKLAKIGAGYGINKIRLTGGEPLIRKNAAGLINMLVGIKGLQSLGLTTNGILLVQLADELYQAGLRKINISLDTLDKNKYNWITRGANLDILWAGILKAVKIGYRRLKLNVVVIKGFNDEELPAFARLTREFPIDVRFIEFMPFKNAYFRNQGHYISSYESKQKIAACEKLIPNNSKSELRYKLVDGLGELSFISPLSRPFCASCNRLRLTADGQLRNCLFSPHEINIKSALRTGATEAELAALLNEAVRKKPLGHELSERIIQDTGRAMHSIGG